MKSNNLITKSKSCLTLLLLATLFTPLLSFAQSSEERPQRSPGEKFCENIDEIKDRVLTNVESRRGAKFDQRGTRQAEFEARKDERLANLEAAREAADETRTERYEKLEALADTDEKQTAVSEFKSTTEAAVAERRAAVDAAIEEFESDVLVLRDESEQAIAELADAIEDAFSEAFTDAETACDNDTPGAEVAAELRTDIETALSEVRETRSQYEYKDDFEILRDARRTKVEAAMNSFKATLESAKAELLSVLQD